MRTLSLCSGYGGLDLAVEQVFGAVTAAHAEIDPAACKILAARWPGVPNIGDVKEVGAWYAHRWRGQFEIVTAGYPCQPFSAAGLRKGTDDPRHLWPFIAATIRGVRPRYVVLENVAGHRSLGFGAVLADLAAMRYVGSWVSLRASDVGACHGRERVFILARDADRMVGEAPGAFGGRPGSVDEPGSVERALGPDRLHHASDPAGARRESVDAGASSEAARGGRERLASGSAGSPSTADADSLALRLAEVAEPGSSYAAEPGHPVRWGKYEAAIRRHEFAIGRPAPHPSVPAPKGGQRLNPRFVEWMQFLPDGWVTDVPGLTHDEQLHALGNGVVPPQAAEALRRMLAIQERAA